VPPKRPASRPAAPAAPAALAPAPARARAAALPPEQRRAAIVAATVPLLREHGAAVSTRQIAEAAGVAEGTIFRVFPDKDAVIEAAFEAAIDPLPIVAAMRSIDLSLPLEDRLVQGVELLQRHISGLWQLIAILGRTTPPRTQAHRPELGDSALAGLFEPDRDRLSLSPEQAARLLRGLIIGCTHPAIVLDVPPMTPTEIVSVLLDGIRTGRRTDTT
jgi:AcrR family transcriptional regulator